MVLVRKFIETVASEWSLESSTRRLGRAPNQAGSAILNDVGILTSDAAEVKCGGRQMAQSIENQDAVPA